MDNESQSTSTPVAGFSPCPFERVVEHNAKFQLIEDKFKSYEERQIRMDNRTEEMWNVLCVSNGKRAITDAVSNCEKQIDANASAIREIRKDKKEDDKDIKKHIVTGVFTLIVAWVVSKIGGTH